MTITLTYSCYRSWLMPVALRALGHGVLKRMTISTLILLKFICQICYNCVS